MLALKCDRCHKYYSPSVNCMGQKTTRKVMIKRFLLSDCGGGDTEIENHEVYDFCPDCMKSFGDWLNLTLKMIVKENDQNVGRC